MKLDCSACKFDEYFNQLNGYGCFQKSNNETICTCPDLLWTINQPCRQFFFTYLSPLIIYSC